MTVIIGIDPGSRRTGYGIIRLEGNRHIHIASDCIDVSSCSPHDRLRQIYLSLREVVQQYRPQEAAIEQVFMSENPNSAIKLGQARGAAIVALDMPIEEYAARLVKKSIVGNGAAGKEQIQYMVQKILNLSGKLQADTADALAVALCHAHARNFKKLERLLT